MVADTGKREGAKHLQVVEGSDLEEAWQVYESSFAEIREDHPCRQSLTRREFKEFMRNTEIVKLLVYENGELVAGSLFTKNLGLVPWISEAYYNKHFPEYLGRRMYAQSFFVRPDKRGRGILQTLANEIKRHMKQEGIVVTFCDFGGRNEITFTLLLKTVHAKSLPSRLVEIQTYDAIIINGDD
ncbi:MAG: GNAT family N-acetyltransferase [bacterium]|nr:GNAT family N-acetyltransferase [bacterium]